jgi:hypothetical protein
MRFRRTHLRCGASVLRGRRQRHDAVLVHEFQRMQSRRRHCGTLCGRLHGPAELSLEQLLLRSGGEHELSRNGLPHVRGLPGYAPSRMSSQRRLRYGTDVPVLRTGRVRHLPISARATSARPRPCARALACASRPLSTRRRNFGHRRWTEVGGQVPLVCQPCTRSAPAEGHGTSRTPHPTSRTRGSSPRTLRAPKRNGREPLSEGRGGLLAP